MDAAQAIIVAAIMKEAGRLADSGSTQVKRISDGNIQWAIEDANRIIQVMQQRGLLPIR